jgi:DNA-binding transcriptional ArsR family regulator
MKLGPNIVGIAALIGDRARADILTALMSGKALTAMELADVANVSKQTASSHLAKLMDRKLLTQAKQGRHRYFRLASEDVAHLLESLMGVAQRVGETRLKTGPNEPALRRARVCYDHLAGDVGVQILDSMQQQRIVNVIGEGIELTSRGNEFCNELGIEIESLRKLRRPLCRACLDWSVRRHHLAGSLGAALLARFVARGWAKHLRNSRVVTFTAAGERALRRHFALQG